MKQPRDSFVFYRSVWDAVECIPLAQQLATYKAIIAYALDGTMPSLTGPAMAIFLLIKPQIDANDRRYQNGKKGAAYGVLGGRPKKSSLPPAEIQPAPPAQKPQQNPQKTPPPQKLRLPITPKEKEKEKEYVTVKDNEKEKETETAPVTVTGYEQENAPITDTQQLPPELPPNKQQTPLPPSQTKQQYADLVSLTPDQYQSLLKELGEQEAKACIELLSNYKGSSGKTYESDYHAIKKWVISARAQQKIAEPLPPTSSYDDHKLDALEQLHRSFLPIP